MMFRSLSSCVPNSNVQTSYRATYRHRLVVTEPGLIILCNGITVTQYPHNVNINDTIEARLTTPAAYLGYRFYQYFIDNITQYFAVVNRNNFNPTIKIPDRKRKWYNYINFAQEISFSTNVFKTPTRLAGFGHGLIDVEELHVILDPLTYGINFYDKNQTMISRVELPASPIEYKKMVSDQQVGTYTHDLIVICSDFKVYRVRFDRRYYSSEEFKPKALPFFSLDDLPFQQDLPTGGSFLDLAKKKFLNSLFPVVTALDIKGNEIWLAGAGAVYVVNKNFQLQFTINVPGEEITCLTCWKNGAVLTTKSHRAIYVNTSQTIQLYAGVVLGTPCQILNDRLVIPEPESQRLLVFSDLTGAFTTWPTPDFLPAYTRMFENRLWVTGYDTIDVLEYMGDDVYRVHKFAEKVTLVSVVGTSILASHYLRNYVTLDLTGIYKIIPFTVEPRLGPASHIGTPPVQVKMLGQQGLVPRTPDNTIVYVNGIENEPANSNDWVGVSFKSTVQGNVRTSVILGETAIDYDVRSVTSARLTDHYLTPNVAVNKLTGVTTFSNTATTGNNINGITANIEIGFPFTVYGNIYSNINIGTNGYITFGSNLATEVSANIKQFDFPAIYAMIGDYYQGLPLDNRDPNNIQAGQIDSIDPPGIYWNSQQFREFDGLRLRWVGTKMSTYPFGNLLPVYSTTINHNQIPVSNLNLINIDDYVSGNGITSSTQVTGKEFYSITASIKTVDSVTNSFIFKSIINGSAQLYTPPPKVYANIHVNGQLQGRISNVTASVFNGNSADKRWRILSVSGTNVIVNNHIDNLIDNTYQIGFAYYSTPSIMNLSDLRDDLISANRTTDTITVIYHSTAFKRSLVTIDDWNKVYNGQSIYGPIESESYITSKQIIIKTAKLIASKTITVESNVTVGNFVTVSVVTTNVPNGTQIPYSISGTNVTLSDFRGLTTLSGYFIINGNYDSFTLYPEEDSLIEGVETVTVTIGDISPAQSTTLSVSFNIDDTGDNNISDVESTTISVTEYAINYNSAMLTNIPAGTTLSLYKTMLTFPTSATNASFATFIYARLDRVYCDRAITATAPGTGLFEGNFATISTSVSVTENTDIRFKKYMIHPASVYEVGLYSGRNFQYIELYYTGTHDTSKQIGISTGLGTVQVKTSFTANQSYLFGSYAASGIWEYLGPGCFVDRTLGFVSRTPLISTVPAVTETEARFEFYIEQNTPVDANVTLGLSYGELRVNGAPYYGFVGNIAGPIQKINPDMFVSVTVPFNTSLRPVAPILSIGEYQIALPSVPESNRKSYTISTNLYPNVIPDDLLTANVTIDYSGLYYIPNYYRSHFAETGINLIFKRTRFSSTIILSKGAYHEFIVNDIITVENINASTRLYDVREIALIGPKTYKIILRTPAPGPWFDIYSYATLEQPYTRLLTQVPRQDGYLPDELHFDGEPAYFSGNYTLTSGMSVSNANLLIDNPSVNFIVNGTSYGRYVTNVTTGSNIELQWYIPNYYEEDTIVYQVQKDWDGSNIRYPVAVWTVNNLPVSNEGVAIVSPVNANFFVDKQTLPAKEEIVNSIDMKYYTGVTFRTYEVSSKFLSKPDLIEFAVERKFVEGPVRIETEAPVSLLNETNFITKGPIINYKTIQGTTSHHDLSQPYFVEQGTKFFPNVSSIDTVVPYTLIGHDIANPEFIGPVTQFNANITGINSFMTTYFLSSIDGAEKSFASVFYFGNVTRSERTVISTTVSIAPPIAGKQLLATQLDFDAPSERTHSSTIINLDAPTEGLTPPTYFDESPVSQTSVIATNFYFDSVAGHFFAPNVSYQDHPMDALVGPKFYGIESPTTKLTLNYTETDFLDSKNYEYNFSSIPQYDTVKNELPLEVEITKLTDKSELATHPLVTKETDVDELQEPKLFGRDTDKVELGTQELLTKKTDVGELQEPKLIDNDSEKSGIPTLIYDQHPTNLLTDSDPMYLDYTSIIDPIDNLFYTSANYIIGHLANIVYLEYQPDVEDKGTSFNNENYKATVAIGQTLIYEFHTSNIDKTLDAFFITTNSVYTTGNLISSNNYLGTKEFTKDAYLMSTSSYMPPTDQKAEIFVPFTKFIQNYTILSPNAEYIGEQFSTYFTESNLYHEATGIPKNVEYIIDRPLDEPKFLQQWVYDVTSELYFKQEFVNYSPDSFYWAARFERVTILDNIVLDATMIKDEPHLLDGFTYQPELEDNDSKPVFDSVFERTTLSSISGFEMNPIYYYPTPITGFISDYEYDHPPTGIDFNSQLELVPGDAADAEPVDPLLTGPPTGLADFMLPRLVKENPIPGFFMLPYLIHDQFIAYNLPSIRYNIDFNIVNFIESVRFIQTGITLKMDPELDQEPVFIMEDQSEYGIVETRIQEFIRRKDWDGHVPNVTICSEASYSNNLYFDIPNGYIVRNVDFASFGTPQGDCKNYSQHGTYHDANSLSIVRSLVLNRTGNLAINVGVPYFTNLFPAQEQKLAVQLTCAAETASPHPNDAQPKFLLFDQTYRAAIGGFKSYQEAANMANKYVSAMPYCIPGTNYWNFRIFFNTHIYAVLARPESYYYDAGKTKPVPLPDFFKKFKGTEKSYYDVLPADPGYKRSYYNHPTGFVTPTGAPTNDIYANMGPDKYVIARRMRWPAGWLIRGG